MLYLPVNIQSICHINDPQWRQCCCNCKNHLPDHKHCMIDRKSSGKDSKCICNEIKGYICHPVEDRYVSGWPEHNVGCEMYDPIKR